MPKCLLSNYGDTQHNDVDKTNNNNIIEKDIIEKDIIEKDIKEKDNIENHQDVECPICYDKLDLRNCNVEEINDNTPIKLDCGHIFHHKCILATFKTNLINNRKTRRCPFCREVTSHLPLQKHIFPIRNIHKEYDLIKSFLHKGDFKSIYEISKKYNFLNEHKCHAIVTTGNNRGMQCKKK